MAGVPTLLWKLIEEIRPGDHVVLQRTPPVEFGPADWFETMEALLAGAFISEGFVSESRAGFDNLDRDYFDMVVAAYDAVVGGPRYVDERTIASGSRLHELDVQNLTAFKASRLGEMCGQRSADKVVPDWLWQSPAAVKRVFLQALFEGDGSCSASPRNTIQVCYSTRSRQLAVDVQQMLLDFGVISRRNRHATGEYKVVITNRAQAELFAERVGFGGAKRLKLERILRAMPATPMGLDDDHAPGLGPVHSDSQRRTLGGQGVAEQAQHRSPRTVAAGSRRDSRPHRRSRCARHRHRPHRRPLLLRACRFGDRRRCPAGVQPAGGYRRPRLHHQWLRQSQHRSTPHSAGDGDVA